MTSIYKFIKKRQTFERVRLIGPYSKGTEVLDALHRKGFSVMRSGPYSNKSMFPKVDASRFLFIAEREIVSETDTKIGGSSER